MKILAVLKALYKGRSLTNLEAWKNVQMVSTVLAGVVFSVLRFFPDFVVADEVVNMFVTGLGYIFAGVALYLTPATTEKIGFNDHEKDNDFSGGGSVDRVPSVESGPGQVSHSSVNQGAKGLRGGL